MGLVERSIEAVVHGRYLVDAAGSGLPMIVGFHGYAESAEMQLERLQALRGEGQWLLLAIEGLHHFYRGRSRDVVASWMTRQDRELAIADNIRYVTSVIDDVGQNYSPKKTRVLAGFSQGVAMAFRAATACVERVDAVIVLGSDIPPEIDTASLARIGRALIGRGERDEWYTTEKLAADERRLRDAGVDFEVVIFDAAHEWTNQFSQAAARLLHSVKPT